MLQELTPESIRKQGDLIYENVFTAYGEGEPLVCSECNFAMASTIGEEIWLLGNSLYIITYANNPDNIIDQKISSQASCFSYRVRGTTASFHWRNNRHIIYFCVK